MLLYINVCRIFTKEPDKRPSASEVLKIPFVARHVEVRCSRNLIILLSNFIDSENLPFVYDLLDTLLYILYHKIRLCMCSIMKIALLFMFYYTITLLC